jgi:hypothetical protein
VFLCYTFLGLFCHLGKLTFLNQRKNVRFCDILTYLMKNHLLLDIKAYFSRHPSAVDIKIWNLLFSFNHSKPQEGG